MKVDVKEIDDLKKTGVYEIKNTVNNKTYKNLYFTNVPLHQGIDDVNELKSVNTEM
jgi:hypothetical protein